MRDDFEISAPELDVAVETAVAHGALGARMTGGGFGGSAIAIVPAGAVEAVSEAVTKAFADHGFPSPSCFAVTASGAGRPGRLSRRPARSARRLGRPVGRRASARPVRASRSARGVELVDEGDEVGHRVHDPGRAVREPVDLAACVEPVRTRIVRSPASRPLMMSVSIRSPIITVLSECASMRLSALRIIRGLGLPMKYGSTPVARVMSAATDPVAGSGPSADGPVGSGFVAMNREPSPTSRIALVIPSNE